MWKQHIDFSIKNFLTWHIHVMVAKEAACQWQFTGFYGHHEVGKCNDTWNLLKSLYMDEEVSWMVCEDFNEILSHDEKWRVMLDLRNSSYIFERSYLIAS